MFKSAILLIFAFFTLNVGICQKYDAEVIDYRVECDIVGSTLKVGKYYTIQINNRNGEKYGFFNIPYSKNESLFSLSAGVYDLEGNEIKSLRKNDIIERNANTEYLYTDDFVKSFQLKHSEYPYLVKCSYGLEERGFMTITHWSPVIFKSIPTKKASLQVNVPDDYKIREFSKGVSFKMSAVDKRVVYEYSGQYLKPLKEEIYSNPANYYPQVMVVPEDFKYGVPGSNRSWELYGKWVDDLGYGLHVLPENELLKIDRLIKDLTDKREIVKVLYNYLQDHTRYINVSIGIGGHKPYPAKYVSVNKYGDCKALSNYMKALLKYAGIDSYYTLVKAGDQIESLHKEISCAQFNHAILAVPLGTDTIWLENTSNTSPFNYLGTFTQNREVLITSALGSKIVHTPALQVKDVTCSKNITYTLNLDGTAITSLRNTYRGENFEQLNAIATQLNEEDKDRIIREIMMFENYEVKTWEIEKRHRDSAKIVLNASLYLLKFLNTMGDDYFFSLNPVGIPSFTNPANRTLPVELPYPIAATDTVRYILPNDFALKNNYEPVKISNSFGNFEIKITSENNVVTVIKLLTIFPGTYTLEQYPDFYAFIDSVRKTEKSKIVIKKQL